MSTAVQPAIKESTRLTPEGDVIHLRHDEHGYTLTTEFPEVHVEVTGQSLTYYNLLTRSYEPCLLLGLSWKEKGGIEFPTYEREFVYLPSQNAYCFSWELEFSSEEDALQTFSPDSYPWEGLETLSGEFPLRVRWVIQLMAMQLAKRHAQ